MQYHAIPCNTMQYHAIPCNTMQYHVIPCNTMQYHAIPCNTMQYNAIPCNTMQYHASLMTADGAYHCPVGSIMAIFNVYAMQTQIFTENSYLYLTHSLQIWWTQIPSNRRESSNRGLYKPLWQDQVLYGRDHEGERF